MSNKGNHNFLGKPTQTHSSRTASRYVRQRHMAYSLSATKLTCTERAPICAMHGHRHGSKLKASKNKPTNPEAHKPTKRSSHPPVRPPTHLPSQPPTWFYCRCAIQTRKETAIQDVFRSRSTKNGCNTIPAATIALEHQVQGLSEVKKQAKVVRLRVAEVEVLTKQKRFGVLHPAAIA